jgi:hypothetical protein
MITVPEILVAVEKETAEHCAISVNMLIPRFIYRNNKDKHTANTGIICLEGTRITMWLFMPRSPDMAYAATCG